MRLNFFDAVKNRRTVYAIGKEKIVSEDAIVKTVEEALLHTPSAFNSQSARTLVLFNGQHDRLWELTEAYFKKILPEEAFAQTAQRLAGFKAGYATVLFFEDQSVIEGLQSAFSAYADNFPLWSLQSSGMVQFVVWTGLEALGLGASLQHYNPLIDEDVKKEWGVPESWKLMSQLVVGNPLAPAGEKEFSPIENRIKVFK